MMLNFGCMTEFLFHKIVQKPDGGTITIRHSGRTLHLQHTLCMVKVNGDLPYAELAAPAKYDMEDSVVLHSSIVSVVINMITVDRDVIEIKGAVHGKSTHDRFSHGVIESCGTLDIDIFITVIDCNIKVRQTSISS